MLVNDSYFIGPYVLPQLGQPAVVEHLDNLIAKYEPEVMRAALGYELYEAFKEGIDVGSDEVIDTKWVRLRDGYLFTNRAGRKQQWLGLASEDENGMSVLAMFIYYFYMREIAEKTVAGGRAKTESENVEIVNPAHKLCEVWNEACRNIQVLWDMLDADNSATYTDYKSYLVDSNYFKTLNAFGI